MRAPLLPAAGLLVASTLLTLQTAAAQGVRAAVLNCPGPQQIALVQKTTSNLRWRVWTGSDGAGAWGAWRYLGGNPIQHQTAGQAPAVARWCDFDDIFASTRRHLLAAYPVYDHAAQALTMVGLDWRGDPAVVAPTARNVQLPSEGFDPRAAVNWELDQVSVFGLRARYNAATGQLQFLPREAWMDGRSWGFVDWGTATVPAADAIDMGPRAAAVVRNRNGTSDPRFLLYREIRAGTSRVMLLHQPRPADVQHEAALDLGLPAGTSSPGTPLLLYQGTTAVNSVALNAFVVARLANGERHLFERFNPTPFTAAADGTPGYMRWTPGWRDAGRPSGQQPSPGMADDLEITSAITWADGNVLRINLFGTRWGRRVEYWWDGSNWHWSVGDSLHAAMGGGARIVDAAATFDAQRPRLTVFAQAANGDIWEQAWDWNRGTWLPWASLQ